MKTKKTTLKKATVVARKTAPSVAVTTSRTPAAKRLPTPPAPTPSAKPKPVSRKPRPSAPASAAAPSPVPAPVPPPAARLDERILRELSEVRVLLGRLAAPATSAEQSLDEGATALRRLLSDLMDKRLEGILSGVVAVRDVVPTGTGVAVEERLDRLIEELGGVAFIAARAEYFDPLIHAVGAERGDPALPDGVIVETIKPGIRTGRGTILTRALVAINRRT